MFKTGFYQDDLKVYYHQKIGGEAAINSPSQYAGNCCHLIYVYKGKTEFQIGDKLLTLNDGSLLILRPHVNFRIIEPQNDKFQELLIITFIPQVFAEVEGDIDFLRIFYRQKYTAYSKSELSGMHINALSCTLRELLQKHYGRVHVESRVTAMISQLCLLYDKMNENEFKATDNISVRIMEYINRHYLEKISINTIREKYFVSATTINAIVKKNTCKTFKNYINALRLNDADMLIKSGKQPTSVYNIAGFTDYSAFYRAYKKRFGITPSERLCQVTKQVHWPLA